MYTLTELAALAAERQAAMHSNPAYAHETPEEREERRKAFAHAKAQAEYTERQRDATPNDGPIEWDYMRQAQQCTAVQVAAALGATTQQVSAIMRREAYRLEARYIEGRRNIERRMARHLRQLRRTTVETETETATVVETEMAHPVQWYVTASVAETMHHADMIRAEEFAYQEDKLRA